MGYLEMRKHTARGNSISTDMMRHLHTRQYLGRAVIVGPQPAVLLSVARKQWLKLSRYIQKQRAATLDADKILKYTHTVTHMQHLRFTAKAPLDAPNADIYFIDPKDLAAIPPDCRTLYISAAINNKQAQTICRLLPEYCLVVDYADNMYLKKVLQPKRELEQQMHAAWKILKTFLDEHHIPIQKIAEEPIQKIEIMEEALDILLGTSRQFLQLAAQFQHTLECARPLRLSKSVRQQYDAAVLLAHRVQALSTSGFTGQFLEAYNEDDTFFLYDSGREQILFTDEQLAATIARNQTAGRFRLAAALRIQPGLHHELLAKTQAV